MMLEDFPKLCCGTDICRMKECNSYSRTRCIVSIFIVTDPSYFTLIERWLWMNGSLFWEGLESRQSRKDAVHSDNRDSRSLTDRVG
jgi:hypothetical protein